MFALQSVAYRAMRRALPPHHAHGRPGQDLHRRPQGREFPSRDQAASTFAPRLGRTWCGRRRARFFDGSIDDVRAFTTALACD